MTISAAVVAAIEQHARDVAPDECCGLLLGLSDAIRAAIRARNAASEPDRRYEIDPVDHFDAIRRARRMQLEVIGAYHSHPRSAAVPSETDRAEAFEHFVFVIVGRVLERPEIRAWRLAAGNFAEVPLVPVA